MSSLASAIFSQITTQSGITALIGTRLYPEYVRASDQVFPLAVIKIENQTRQVAADGPTGYATADIVISCIDLKHTGAEALANAMVAALDGTRGTWSGVAVTGCFVADDGIKDDVITEPSTELILAFAQVVTLNLSFHG